MRSEPVTCVRPVHAHVFPTQSLASFGPVIYYNYHHSLSYQPGLSPKQSKAKQIPPTPPSFLPLDVPPAPPCPSLIPKRFLSPLFKTPKLTIMDSVVRSFDPGLPKIAPKPVSFPNGTLKKHRPEEEHHQYRECLRNHAASLGGHAVDGCCEFMPSHSADPAVPTSITCAACGCHRNFHRRLPPDARLRHEETDGDDEDEESSEDEDDDDDGGGERRLGGSRRRSFVSPSPYSSSSAPHMLLALSGVGGPVVGSAQRIAAPIAVASGGFEAAAKPRKRFRTKFSAEQKERMQEMSEQLGWRLQKKDEAVVEEFCRQIGVERGVFKVWMHNNKHTYHPGSSSRRREIGGGGGEGNGIGSGSGSGSGGGDSNCVVNGSPSSS